MVAGLLAGATVAAAGATYAVTRRRSAGHEPDRDAAPAAAQPEFWSCSCGARFRVAGAGRHRVLWVADAPEDEPVLGDRCPSCDQPLPGSPGAEEADMADAAEPR
jgi:hypothetical protein